MIIGTNIDWGENAMPIDVFRRMKNRIKPPHIYAFGFSFVFGLLAHFYRMTNWLPNWDSLVFRNDPQHMESLGRWFLPFASGISSNYELPWLNGLLSILYISTAVVFICAALEVRSRLTAAMIGAVTVTFPTVTSTLTYCYIADAYALSFLLVCIAVYLLTRKKMTATILSVLLLALSMGIYQAYITAAIALLLCSLIVRLVTGRDTASASLKSAFRYMLCGVLAVLLYYGIHLAVTTVMHVEMSDYQNISDTFSLREFDIKKAVLSSYYVFFKFFFDFSEGFNFYSVLNIAIFAVLAIGYVALAAKHIRKVSGYLLTALYILLTPVGCTALYLANSELDYHTLMKMGYVVAYIFLALLYEKLHFAARRADAIKAWAVVGLCFAMVYSNTVTANIAYHKLQIAYERSYGILVRISDRIQALDGAENISRLLVVGSLDDSESYAVNFPPEITGTTDGLLIRHDDETVRQSVMTSALNDYCDMSLTFIRGSEAEALKESEAVGRMPCWPRDGSIIRSGDTVILKLSEETK